MLDSYGFLVGKLDTVVGTLRDKVEKGDDPTKVFSATNELLQTHYKGEMPLDLATRKSVFPYSHFTGPETLNETEFPPKEAFYDQLKETPIEDSEYQFGRSVWDYICLTSN